jgi:hypothetical protein
MTRVIDRDEVRQIIVVGIRVVDKATLGYYQLAYMDTGTVTTVPALWTFATRLLDRFDGPLHVLLFFFATQTPVLTPAPAMRARVMATLTNPLSNLRIPSERHRTRKERHRDLVLITQA